MMPGWIVTGEPADDPNPVGIAESAETDIGARRGGSTRRPLRFIGRIANQLASTAI